MDERTRIRDQINRSADRQAMLANERTRVDQTHRFDAFVLTAILVCVSLATIRGFPIDHAAPIVNTAAAVLRGIDPETAGWAELALLPGLGESAASHIVKYRETWHSKQSSGQTRVFQAPSDLQKVKGIGDKTVQRIRSFLRFPKSDPRH